MIYATERDAISRTPVTLVILTFDYCSNTFGAAPCTAAGTKCYNTYPTCKDKANYTKSSKDYKFTSIDAPLPFSAGERPYLDSINYAPTEIKTSLTVNARVDLVFVDEDDTDVGIDPYYADRTKPIPGTFWRKLIARNRNYKGRSVKIYEGFLGLAEGDYVQTWYGIIDNIKIDKDSVTIGCVDLLKKLSEIEVPAKLGLFLPSSISSAATQITLNSATAIDATGMIRIGDEIIGYGARSTVTHILSNCTRAEFQTIAEAHSEKAKVQQCRHFAPGNPFDHMVTILKTDAGISTDYIDEAAFTSCSTWPLVEPASFAALISEPISLDKLYYELVEMTDCKTWVAEDLKITICRNIGNEPARPYTTWTDDANIVYGSVNVDLNEQSRITRAAMYYDKDAIGDIEETSAYGRLAVTIDADAESSKEYNDLLEKKVFNRWFPSSANASTSIDMAAKYWTGRRVMNYRNALPIISLSVERKDADAKVGDYIMLHCDDLNQANGNDSTGKYQIVYRDFKGDKADYKLQKMPERKVCFIGSTTRAEGYTSASAAEKEYGYLGTTLGEMGNQDPAYFIW